MGAISRIGLGGTIVLAIALALRATAFAQTSGHGLPRLPDGHPDLQGFWDNGILTPLQRPAELADKAVFTKEEAASWQRDGLERFRKTRGEVEVITNGEQNGIFADVKPRTIGADLRTSLIVDPPNGLVPALTPDAQAREAARRQREKDAPFDDPESFIPSERCLVWGAGPPMIPVPYNNYLKIVQTRDAALIVNEMIHDARVVPLDGRPHLPASIRQWKGDSRGHWEGDTLVIETTNFTGKTPMMGSGRDLRVVERFTRTGADTLRYEFVMDDPASFTQSWTAAWTLTRAAGPLYEYACHEANYSMQNILKGARLEENSKGKKE